MRRASLMAWGCTLRIVLFGMAVHSVHCPNGAEWGGDPGLNPSTRGSMG